MQKSALKIILPEENYRTAMDILNIETLVERRQKLCLKFAENCLNLEKTKHMFPLNNTDVNTSKKEKFKVTFAKTERMKQSSIPYMQRLLNKAEN